jgi:hypothetical protein
VYSSASGRRTGGWLHKPPIPAGVPARPCRVDHQRSEPPHPPIHRHVLNLDTAFNNRALRLSHDGEQGTRVLGVSSPDHTLGLFIALRHALVHGVLPLQNSSQPAG